MSERGRVAVTGATGRIGGRVAAALAARGVPLRLVVRDASRAPRLPGAELAVAAYGRTEAARSALAGVDTLFLVSAAEHPDRVAQHTAMLDAALDAGVGRVVYLSFVGASPEATFTLARDHWATEQHLARLGLPATVLRDNIYADFAPLLVSADGAIRGPGGTGRAAFVAQADVAEVATEILADPGPWTGRTLDLTGPEALSLAEVAELLSRTLGRPVRYVEETVPEAWESRRVYGAPDWQVEGWVSTYIAIARGELAAVSPTVAEITEHPARSVADALAGS